MAKKTETKKATTKKPTGLSITRKGQWYTLSWKIGDNNYSDGQQLGHHKSWQKKGAWTSVAIGNTTTSKSIKVLNDNYFPNTSTKLKRITFRVRGNRQEYTKETSKKITTHKFSWSDWATKEIDLDVPNNPSISAEPDNELTNVCAFPWSVTATDDSKRPYTNMQWETVLVKESNVTDGSKLTWKSNQLGWATGTSAAKSGTITRTEDTALLASGAYTRWVRVRARGIAGASDWKYAKHNYSVPYKPRITSVSAEDNRVGGFSCKVTWTADASTSHPIDKTMVQYTITEPEEGLTCPSGASWSDANISKDTGGKDSAFFSIDDTLSKDQCLFVRVNVQHNSQMTYGTPTLAKVGYLKDPTGLSVETDNTTHRATITATNASNVEDSFLAVVYQTASNPSGAFVVGIIPHGSSSVIVQCPDWSGESAVAFGVYAVVGSYQRQQRQDGVSNYRLNVRMRSEGTIWDGGAVPSAPENVTVVQTSIKGTVQITWDWTWEGANGAEVSWADHEDAWESTDEPDKYLISKLHAAKWNISGLEVGKKWYMRVRLVSETADSTTNGPWSDLVSIDLSSAPTVPTLYLSRGVIPQDGSVTASWAYSTTDGTMQAYAEICEATITGEGITYGDIIAHTETAQQTVINATDVGWQSGEIHNLCVRVTSASGHVSDSWSDPVSVTVAEPLECEITNTSLVQETIETNPQEFEPADVVSFETDVEEDITKLQVNLEPIQDLHGYDHPWVGGAGKNIYSYSNLTSKNIYRATVTPIDGEDNALYLSGAQGSMDTPTLTVNSWGSVRTYYGMKFDVDTTITLSCKVKNYTPNCHGYIGIGYKPVDSGSDGNLTTVARQFFEEVGETSIQLTGVIPANQYVTIFLSPMSKATDGELVQYAEVRNIQIELGSTATAYEPYENICPISGWDSVDAYKSGKNVLPKYAEGTTRTQNGITGTANADGSITYVGTSTGTFWGLGNSASILVKAGTYTLSARNNTDIAINIVNAVTGTYIDGVTGSNSKAITFANDTKIYYYTAIASGKTVNTTATYQLEFGSTATSYEPYQGQTITKALGQTVYGATLDVVSGELTVTRFLYGSTANWVQYNASNGYKAYRLNGVYQPATNWLPMSNLISEYGSFNSSSMDRNIIQRPSIVSGEYVMYMALEDDILPTEVQICYELATPQTIQLTPEEVETLVGENHIWSDAGQVEVRIAESTRDVLSLKEMPLSVTATGAGVGGVTTLAVERAEDYRIDRPDESHADGYEGETVFLYSQMGEDQISANVDSLIGALDDGAKYRIVATVQDGLGQSAEDSIDFEVHWTHQAVTPEATVVIDDENLVAKITPVAPTGALAGDTCDIYRLSADRPELIVQDASFGSTYVDPYPAIGEFGGHRVVFKTVNGDYIMEDNQIAWTDFGEEEDDILDLDYHVIDFDGTRIVLNYNVDLSSQWDKDFTETKYLGGSVQGDWNPAVSRSGSISATAITITDQDMIRDMRRLASYSGICHVRTKDGSSYAADIQVSEDRSHEDYDKIATFSMTVTRVDPERLEGLPLELWQGEQ